MVLGLLNWTDIVIMESVPDCGDLGAGGEWEAWQSRGRRFVVLLIEDFLVLSFKCIK